MLSFFDGLKEIGNTDDSGCQVAKHGQRVRHVLAVLSVINQGMSVW